MAEIEQMKKTFSRRRNLTSGPIVKTLILSSLPTVFGNMLQSFNGSINAMWIGQYLTEKGLVASANTNIVFFMVLSLVFGFGIAATVLVAQSLGKKDEDGARQAFGSALGFCVVLSVIIVILGEIFLDNIFHVLATPVDVLPMAKTYAHIMLWALPASIITIMISMGLRGGGDFVTPFYFMAFSCLIDAILNPLLIAGLWGFPQLGIAGSGLSTVIASYSSLMLMLFYISRQKSYLSFDWEHLHYLLPRKEVLMFLLTRGIPMGAQLILMSASALIMVALVNAEGVIASGAYSATQQLWSYLQMPAIGVGAAVSAMVAQNIGAGAWDRVNKITYSGIALSLFVTTVFLSLLLIFNDKILSLFLGGIKTLQANPAIAMGQHIQLWASWSFLFFGAALVFFAAMRANGYVIGPLLILFLSFFPVRLTFYYISYPYLKADAIWLSFPVSSFILMVLAYILYKSGGWRKKLKIGKH
ncbi:MATE family efflux transporter [Bartonella sp. DGB1]|uniref:MATE family efflux transporter n=1 Tax=Bartonella sp. DGB1 TaxID=3239807 RepID=UPI00352520D4